MATARRNARPRPRPAASARRPAPVHGPAPVLAAPTPAPPASAVTEVVTTPEGVTLRLGAELAVRQVRPLLEAARATLATGQDVVLDFGQVTYVDAASAQVLLAFRRAAVAAGRGLVAKGAGEALQTELTALGLPELVAA